MPFVDSFPLRARGPRTDLCVAYGKFDVSNSGATVTAIASNTSSGLTVTGSLGTYTLNHPKCRFATFYIKVNPADATTVTQVRHVVTFDDQDPTAGTYIFNTHENDSSPVVAAPVDGSEIEIFGVLGY